MNKNSVVDNTENKAIDDILQRFFELFFCFYWNKKSKKYLSSQNRSELANGKHKTSACGQQKIDDAL